MIDYAKNNFSKIYSIAFTKPKSSKRLIMYSIPEISLKFGGELINKNPVKFSKSRIAGSKNTTYILHSKGGCMPGQPELFNINSISKPNLSDGINENRIIRAFRLSNSKRENKSNGIKYIGDNLSSFTYDSYSPNDDQTIRVAINSAYRQIYGNLHAMESERPIELERRLRNGDLSIREFIRQLAKSPFYLFHYFAKVSQQRSIELNIKHLLGRPTTTQEEIIKHIELINDQGFNTHIDSIIDSDEYIETFGEDTVPFMRCWNSPCGVETASFIGSSKLVKAFATSDNAIHSNKLDGHLDNGKSLLIKDLAIKYCRY